MKTEEKLDRKAVHDFIKSSFKDFNSNTTQEGNTQFIEISHQKSNVNIKKNFMKQIQKLIVIV